MNCKTSTVLQYIVKNPGLTETEMIAAFPDESLPFKLEDLRNQNAIKKDCGKYTITSYGESILDFDFTHSVSLIEGVFSRLELDRKHVLEDVVAYFWVKKKLALRDLRHLPSTETYRAILVRDLKKRKLIECADPTAKKCPEYQITKKGKRSFMIYGKRLEKKYKEIENLRGHDDNSIIKFTNRGFDIDTNIMNLNQDYEVEYAGIKYIAKTNKKKELILQLK